MSTLTGKCDLYDHISMMKHRTKDGSDKKEDLEKARVLYSDIMECFNIFKERTGGVIYQNKKITVSERNQNFIAKKVSFFKIIEHKEIKEDKRLKSGKKEIVTYTYEYWDKEYTLKQLNKRGVWIKVPIYFNSLLELLPYFGYLVSSSCSSNGKETIFISDTNFAEMTRDEYLDYGFESASNIHKHYLEKLAELYKRVVLDYYNPIGRERIETVFFDENLRGKVSRPIDENFRVSWLLSEEKSYWSYWASPKVIDAENGIIEISKEDYDEFIGKSCDVYYVESEDKIHLY